VGFIDIKSSSVHFYVQRNTKFDKTDVVLPFEVERLNLGGAMNLATGIFTVPVAGVYHFEFSALKDVSATRLNIDFQINGAFITRAHMNHLTSGSYDRVSLSASFHLKQNDRIGLYNSYGALYDPSDTHFTGWLVEEDLFI